MRDNIIMVSWDSARADHFSFYGYDRETTPYLSSQLDDALILEDTHVSAVGTPASFSGVFTGQHSDGNILNPDPGHWSTSLENKTLLPEILQDAGYHTGAFHFNPLMSSEFGWNQGWDTYQDGRWAKEVDQNDGSGDLKKKVFEELQKYDMANFAMHLKKMIGGGKPEHWEKLQDEISGFIEDAPEPFFLWVLLMDTHHPYLPPEEHRHWPQPGTRSTYAYNYVMRRHRDLVGTQNQKIINSYDNTYRYADMFMQWLDGKLEEQGYGDDPMIFHGDHGDEMGEHANYGHRPLMYNTVTEVPLVIRNIGETGRKEGPHSLLDLGGTILDLAGIDEELGNSKSLLTTNRGPAVVQNLLDERRAAAVVGDEWKVLYHPEGEWGHGLDFGSSRREAYQQVDDPREQDNRWVEAPEDLKETLDRQMERDYGISGSNTGIDQATEDRLRELGYVE